MTTPDIILLVGAIVALSLLVTISCDATDEIEAQSDPYGARRDEE